jgi:septal ring factor EnvC (AmiA/AmiB activator)
MKTLLRRLFVVTGVVASLVVGALSIDAAAAWTRAAAPPAAPVVTIASLQSQLEAERARSASLSDSLKTIDGHSQELAAGLAAADARIAADLKAAEAMTAQLAAAKKQLAALKTQMAAAKAALARAVAAAPAITSTASTSSGSSAPSSTGGSAPTGGAATPPPSYEGGDDGD